MGDHQGRPYTPWTCVRSSAWTLICDRPSKYSIEATDVNLSKKPRRKKPTCRIKPRTHQTYTGRIRILLSSDSRWLLPGHPLIARGLLTARPWPCSVIVVTRWIKERESPDTSHPIDIRMRPQIMPTTRHFETLFHWLKPLTNIVIQFLNAAYAHGCRCWEFYILEMTLFALKRLKRRAQNTHS